jgi:hypothetical protein
MRYRFIITSIILSIVSQCAFGSFTSHSLRFKTAGGHIIKVYKAQIFYDNKVIFKREYDDDILYNSKSNRLIEDDGSVFLFIAIGGSPNFDRLNVFRITRTKAALVADAILSPVKDYDGDGYLEFGGRDITERYPNPDSMYYIPSAYYKIRDGKIRPDNSLTRRKDIELNGLYLPTNQQPDKNGNCCKVIPKPRKKHTAKIRKDADFIPKSFMGSDTITVLATKYVLVDKDDITNATHSFDGSWTFYSDDRTYTPETAARKVKLATVIKIDKSILLLSRMPKGYYARRASKKSPWVWDKLKEKE